jgi:hypothetical protein
LSTDDRSLDAMQKRPPTSSWPKPKYRLDPDLMAHMRCDTGSTTTAAKLPWSRPLAREMAARMQRRRASGSRRASSGSAREGEREVVLDGVHHHLAVVVGGTARGPRR